MYGGSTNLHPRADAGRGIKRDDRPRRLRMTSKGRGGAALATAAIGSFIAGTFATLMLMTTAPLLVEVALTFGPASTSP